MVSFFKQHFNSFLFFILVSAIFEGVEQLFSLLFGINLYHIIPLSSIGIFVIFGFKFHIICCVLPTAITIIKCTVRNKKHCIGDCEH